MLRVKKGRKIFREKNIIFQIKKKIDIIVIIIQRNRKYLIMIYSNEYLIFFLWQNES